MITLDGRKCSKATSMLLSSREMSAICLSWDFLVPGDPGLWQLEQLWGGREVTSAPFSYLLWVRTLVFKTDSAGMFSGGGCINTDDQPPILPLELAPPPLPPGWAG